MIVVIEPQAAKEPPALPNAPSFLLLLILPLPPVLHTPVRLQPRVRLGPPLAPRLELLLPLLFVTPLHPSTSKGIEIRHTRKHVGGRASRSLPIHTHVHTPTFRIQGSSPFARICARVRKSRPSKWATTSSSAPAATAPASSPSPGAAS